mmetsp:Transcript_25434/g.70874  ORF Transcript_25434/g.70874 Transcript_25434/m.70874 type:complete len:275 (-) Transcript_25434:669-1493(-)
MAGCDCDVVRRGCGAAGHDAVDCGLADYGAAGHGVAGCVVVGQGVAGCGVVGCAVWGFGTQSSAALRRGGTGHGAADSGAAGCGPRRSAAATEANFPPEAAGKTAAPAPWEPPAGRVRRQCALRRHNAAGAPRRIAAAEPLCSPSAPLGVCAGARCASSGCADASEPRHLAAVARGRRRHRRPRHRRPYANDSGAAPPHQCCLGPRGTGCARPSSDLGFCDVGGAGAQGPPRFSPPLAPREACPRPALPGGSRPPLAGRVRQRRKNPCAAAPWA